MSPPWFPVPPTGYGGIEWIVWLLAEGLTAQGHEVTLFASGDSRTNAKLEAVYPTAPSELSGRTMPDLRHRLHALEQAGVSQDLATPEVSTKDELRTILDRVRPIVEIS